jgi:hypothetical protein
MFAMRGIYEHGAVRIEEPAAVQTKYDVIVTFLQPADRQEPISAADGIEIRNPDEIPAAEKLAVLQRLSGIAAGNTMTLDDIKAARLARQ